MPCGIEDRPVATLSQLLGRPVSVEEVQPIVARAVARAFELRIAGEA